MAPRFTAPEFAYRRSQILGRLATVDPPRRRMSREVIRITPHWIGGWGLDPDEPSLSVRT